MNDEDLASWTLSANRVNIFEKALVLVPVIGHDYHWYVCPT